MEKSTSSYTAQLTPSDGSPGDGFGSISISGSTIAVGASQASSAYVFVEPAGGWVSATENAKLTSATGAFGDLFGYSISVTGNTVAVGAANDPSDTAVYTYVKPAKGWATTSHYQSKLRVTTASIFGYSVASGPGVVVAGSIGNNGLQGAAYVLFQ